MLLRDVLAHFGATGTQLQVTALNDYAISIPVDDARLFDVIVAYKIDGQPVAVRDRGPMLVMYPFDARPELQHRRYYERARDLADQGDHGAIAGCSSSGAPSSWRSWWPSAPS